MYSVLYPIPDLRTGGSQQQLLELVRVLDKRRFHPIVAPLYDGGSLVPSFSAEDGVEVIGLNRRSKYDVSTLWQMGRLLRGRRIDIVQPFVSPSTFFGLLPASLVGTPVKIATLRSGVRSFINRGARMYERLEDHLVRDADAIVANSEAGRKLLIRRGAPPKRTVVICNGISRERLRLDPTKVADHRANLTGGGEGQLIGIVATLTPAKDHETLLRAAARVVETHPRSRWVIVGDGPYRSQLEAVTADLGLSERVEFLGHQSHVADLIAACDVIVSSSKDYEGHSNSILEAMALGVPVVATDVGGTRELVRTAETGHLVPSQDEASLAHAIEHVLAHPTEARACATRARQMVESRFTVERMVSEYEALYERLLGSKRSGRR